jgi:hypothetical protein
MFLFLSIFGHAVAGKEAVEASYNFNFLGPQPTGIAEDVKHGVDSA